MSYKKKIDVLLHRDVNASELMTDEEFSHNISVWEKTCVPLAQRIAALQCAAEMKDARCALQVIENIRLFGKHHVRLRGHRRLGSRAWQQGGRELLVEVCRLCSWRRKDSKGPRGAEDVMPSITFVLSEPSTATQTADPIQDDASTILIFDSEGTCLGQKDGVRYVVGAVVRIPVTKSGLAISWELRDQRVGWIDRPIHANRGETFHFTFRREQP